MIWYLTETTHSFRMGLNRNINMFICQILFSLPISLSICLFQFHFWSINFTRKMIIWFFELSLLWPVMIPIFMKPLTKAMVTYGHIFINMAFIWHLLSEINPVVVLILFGQCWLFIVVFFFAFHIIMCLLYIFNNKILYIVNLSISSRVVMPCTFSNWMTPLSLWVCWRVIWTTKQFPSKNS